MKLLNKFYGTLVNNTSADCVIVKFKKAVDFNPNKYRELTDMGHWAINKNRQQFVLLTRQLSAYHPEILTACLTKAGFTTADYSVEKTIIGALNPASFI